MRNDGHTGMHRGDYAFMQSLTASNTLLVILAVLFCAALVLGSLAFIAIIT